MGERSVAFDEGLAQRIREILEDRSDAVEKRMFGGLCFMLRGHMACGIVGSELMVRVGAAAHRAALEAPHAREMDFTGRSLTGMVYVAEEGIAEDDDLGHWVGLGLAYAESLPPKGRTATKKRSAKQRPAKKGPRGAGSAKAKSKAGAGKRRQRS